MFILLLKSLFLGKGQTNWVYFVCCLVVFFGPTWQFFIHHYWWWTSNFDLCSATKANEQWRFFSMPNLLWHGASVYNGHLRGSMTSCFPLATAQQPRQLSSDEQRIIVTKVLWRKCIIFHYNFSMILLLNEAYAHVSTERP